MTQSFSFKSQFLLSKGPIVFHSSDARDLSLCNRISATTFPWKSTTSPLFFRSWKSIIVARKNRRRIGWRGPRKTALESISFIASSLKILLEPFDLVIREFCGGNGGGFGFRYGFGGGGFEGWSRKRRKLGFFGFLVVCAFCLLVISWKEFDMDLGLGVLGLSLLGFSIRSWKRGMKDWILGFCCCAVIVLLGSRREELQRWVGGSRVRSPVTEIVRRRIRRRRAV